MSIGPKHTGESWSVGPTKSDGWVLINEKRVIALVDPVNSLHNARLIAASPDLIQVVRTIRDWFADGPILYDSSLIGPNEETVKQLLDRVIAKVEGRTL